MRLLSLFLAITLLAACDKQDRSPTISMEERARILNRSDHLLSITVTDSVTEGKRTWYRMDETNLGEGAAGASSTMALLKEMKPGTILRIYSAANVDVSLFEREGERRNLLVRPVAR